MFDLITCPHCEYVSHINGLIGPDTNDCPRCGRRALYSVAQLLREAEQLREALYLALPFVEDHEGSPIYKPQAVAQAVARIRAALGETAPAKLRQAAPLMLDALQRITHPAADDSDLENALQVIAQATGEPTP